MGQRKYISIADCSICKDLESYESGMQKGGRDDNTYLPVSADKLEFPTRKLSGSIQHRGVLRICPECKCCYAYHSGYDFLVGGSEDYQDLWRLTPAQTKFVYSKKAYEKLVENIRHEKDRENTTLQVYIGKTLVDYYADRQDADGLYEEFKTVNLGLQKVMLTHVRELRNYTHLQEFARGKKKILSMFTNKLKGMKSEALKPYLDAVL